MYTVTFSGENITPWDTLVQHNTRVAKPDIFRQDYEVLGWMKDGILWNFSNPVTEDMELVVRWLYTGTGEPPVTSVADNRWAQFMLFPNPTSDVATLSGLEGGEVVSIVDMRGTVQRQMKATSERIAIDRLPQGIYVVVVAKEGYAKTLKLVVR
jgi:hypothetical protein